MKHIIIGGVAGGATAAARIRRIDEFAEIILIEKGAYISYANCGLPYYIGDVITQRNKLFVQNAESFSQRFAIDVRTQQEAIAIDTTGKTVRIRRNDGTIYEENYDRLLLSPGALAVRPSLPGINEKGIFTLRNVEDTDTIKSYITQHKINKAIVIGAGFVGLEMAENLHNLGINVQLVEHASQVLSPLDYSMASFVHKHLSDQGIPLHLAQKVVAFQTCNEQLLLHLENGQCLSTELVILSIGVRPNIALAQSAGIAIGQQGIRVNAYLETSAKDVYAVGDAIEYPHPITQKPWLNLLAGPANRQGRIVADNMVWGNQQTYEGSIGTAIAKVFSLTVACTGLSAKQLTQEGIKHQSVVIHANSHAGYYPKAQPMTLKLSFSPQTGKILGAQAIGQQGVDKRIDQIAQLIKMGATLQQLQQSEHCYAPPFSSAKDPIAIAAYAADNVRTGRMPIITWREVHRLVSQKHLPDNVILLDVRTAQEYTLGTLSGAIHIPIDQLRNRTQELDPNKQIIVFCAVGLRGYLAQQILHARGFQNVRNLTGGMRLYQNATTDWA